MSDARNHDVPAADAAPARQNLLDLSLSINDIVYVADTTARDALATTLSPDASHPLFVYRDDADTGQELEVTVDGTNWRRIASTTGYQSYTPTLTASSVNPSLGSSPTSSGEYIEDDDTVSGTFDIVFGTSPSAGTGTYSIALPVNANSTTLGTIVGFGYIVDLSGTSLKQVIFKVGTAAGVVNMFIDGSTSGVSNSSPWTWAAGDQIRGSFRYHKA